MKIIKQTGKIMVVVLIIAVLTIPISAFAATLKRGNDFWYSIGNVSGETFAVDGNTAYCVNPLQPIPGNGNYTPTQLNNDSLMKVLYYGYGGIGFNNTIKAKMDSYHNNQNINVTGKDNIKRLNAQKKKLEKAIQDDEFAIIRSSLEESGITSVEDANLMA